MEEGIAGSPLSRITRQLETGETEERGHQGASHRPRGGTDGEAWPGCWEQLRRDDQRTLWSWAALVEHTQRLIQAPQQKLYVISCQLVEWGKSGQRREGWRRAGGTRRASRVPAFPPTKGQEALMKDHRQKSRLWMCVWKSQRWKLSDQTSVIKYQTGREWGKRMLRVKEIRRESLIK